MGRPKIPLIRPPLVVKAAVQILDSDGLEGLSVRRLADEFGVRVASLYRHFENKDDILRQVCQQILLEMEPPDDRITDWRDYVVRTVSGLRRVLLRHPHAIPVMLRYEPQSLIPEMSERYTAMIMERGVPEVWVQPLVEAFDVMLMGSVAMHFAQLNDGDRKDVRATGSLRRADEAFENSLWILADGFRTKIEAELAATGKRSSAEA